MKEFFVEEFSSQESYRRFIKYMLSHSQLFSVIYFRYRENEPMKKRPKMLYEKLKKFKEYSITTSEWPGTITMDDNHIYKLVYYRAEMECFDWLIQVPGLYEWDYPYAHLWIYAFTETDIAGFLLRRMSGQHVYIQIKKRRLRNLQLLEQS